MKKNHGVSNTIYHDESLTNRIMEDKSNHKIDYELLLTKYLHDECSESELKIVAELLTDAASQTVLPGLLHRASVKFHSEFEMNKDHSDELWKQVSREVRSIDQRGKRKRLVLYVSRIAASLLLISGITYFSYVNFFISSAISFISKTTERGQRLTIQLSDGTKVKLNAESKIIFPENFEGDTREVRLTGEAFFEVVRDPKRPFIVSSGEINTKVLGTSFNVNAFPEKDIVVTVATGKVNVSSIMEEARYADSASYIENLEGITLTRGQQAVYNIDNKYLTRSQANFDENIGWKDGVLKFTETRLDEVVEILRRWYNVDIQFANRQLASCRVTSSFKSESIEDILEELKFIFKLNYTTNNREIVISGKGCN